MVALQEDAREWPAQHLAFAVDERDVRRAAATLRARGVETEGPVLHRWMPAESVYFSDPDGNELELCDLVNGESRGRAEA